MPNTQIANLTAGTLASDTAIPGQTSAAAFDAFKFTLADVIAAVVAGLPSYTANQSVFQTIADLQANATLVHLTLMYFTLGIGGAENAYMFYYDEDSVLATTGVSVVRPDSVPSDASPGRFIQVLV